MFRFFIASRLASGRDLFFEMACSVETALFDMMINDICIYYFRLPFVRPMRVGKKTLLDREGFLVRLSDDDGSVGYGEVAPLPGLDAFTLASCRKELQVFSRMVKTGASDNRHFNPVVCFGLESAIFSLATGKSDAVAGCPDFRMEAAVNGLFVPGSDPDAENALINRLLLCGCKTIKVKIGKLSIDKEVASIRRLYERAGGDVLFRLDGNRSLSPGVYKKYYQAMGDLPVEYAEEPLKNGDFERAKDIGWPLAIDESLPSYWDKENCRLHGLPGAVTHVIVKSSTPAGFRTVMRYFIENENSGLLPVVSSVFHSVYGICSMMLFLRQVPGADHTAHGLDTGAFLRSDLAGDVVRVENGRMSARMNVLWEKESPDFRLLTEIEA